MPHLHNTTLNITKQDQSKNKHTALEVPPALLSPRDDVPSLNAECQLSQWRKGQEPQQM
jgi:hypothetical protein